jgi:predicted PurR-regulated permease PerM
MPLYGREAGWRERLTRGAPLAALLAAALLIAYRLSPVLELMAVAMLVALVVRTALDRLREAGLRPSASALVLLSVRAALGAFVWLIVVPNVVGETHTLASEVPVHIDSLTRLFRWLHAHAGFIPDGLLM